MTCLGVVLRVEPLTSSIMQPLEHWNEIMSRGSRKENDQIGHTEQMGFNLGQKNEVVTVTVNSSCKATKNDRECKAVSLPWNITSSFSPGALDCWDGFHGNTKSSFVTILDGLPCRGSNQAAGSRWNSKTWIYANQAKQKSEGSRWLDNSGTSLQLLGFLAIAALNTASADL